MADLQSFSVVLFIFVFTSSLILNSCNKDSIIDKSNVKIDLRDEGPSNGEIDTIRKAFAQTFYKAMVSEPQLRSFIYQKCLIADTSGYELIYIALKDMIVSRGLKFSEILTLYADPGILSFHGNDFFSTLTNLTPLLTISFPDLDNVSLNSWNSNIAPDIATVSTINEKAFTLFSSNNLLGNEIILNDSQTEEDVINGPVLVIYDAENHYLVNSNGVTFQGINIDEYMPKVPNDPRDPGDPEDPNDCWQYFLAAETALEQYLISGNHFYLVEHNMLLEYYKECLRLNTNGGDPPNPCSEPCERDCEEIDEHIVDFKINGWQVYKSIHNQLFEKWFVFHGDILAITINSFGTVGPFNSAMVTRSYKKSDLLDCSPHPCQGIWKTENYRWYTDWKEDFIGSPYQVKWAEVDGGSSTTSLKFGVKAKFKVGEVEIEGNAEVGYSYTGAPIVDLGNSPIFYCDPIIMANNTSSISFRCD